MTAPDLTKLTLAELRRIAIGDGTTADDPYAAVDELHRRAQANALVQAERDEFDEELHTCRAIVGATSEHLHVDLEELVDKLRRTEADSRSWQELATARAQANDALRSAAQEYRNASSNLHQTESPRQDDGVWFLVAQDNLDEALAAAPAAPPTPAAPVTDAEIEAAITMLRELPIARVHDKPNNTMWEWGEFLDRLRALIARRVASAGAAPVDSERWRQLAEVKQVRIDRLKEDLHAAQGEVDKLRAALMRSAVPTPVDSEREAAIMATAAESERDWVLRQLAKLREISEGEHRVENHRKGCIGATIDNIVRSLKDRSAPPAPAGDQDAKLREAVEALETVATKQQKVEIRDAAHRILRGYSPCTNCGKWAHRSEGHWPCNPIAPVATPAESAIAAAPEAPKREPWEERWNEAETGSREELLALLDGLLSHARRIEALERAAQEGSK